MKLLNRIKLAFALTITVVAIVGGFVGLRENYRQRSNMRKAVAHVPIVKAAIGNDPRFAQIILGDYSGAGGRLGVAGFVRTDDDLRELRAIVTRTSPPVAVFWSVTVAGAADFDAMFASPQSQPARPSTMSGTAPANR